VVGKLREQADIEVARLAARQEATVSTAQMHALGLSEGAIATRVRRGGLHRVHHGVYVLGIRRLTPRGWLWAAVLACGGPDAAVISHLSAATVWRMRDRWPAVVDVTTLRAARPRPGIRVHTSRTLTFDDLTHHRGLPITTPARTVVDVTPLLDDRELLRACGEAQFHGHFDRALPEAGPVRLRGALAKLARTGPQRTKSELENTFLAIVDRHDLPPPLVNAPVLTYTVDFLWPEHKLIVETDGRNHLRPIVYEADRRRDAILQLHGHRVVRFTTLHLEEQPADVARIVRRLASGPGCSPSPTSPSPSSAVRPNGTASSMP
jgi:uncharacterized protein DUF559/putative AbiEi antitoxin of type IV toxin-antitoxin system